MSDAQTPKDRRIEQLRRQAEERPTAEIVKSVKDHDRLTIILNAHHQQFGENPKSINHHSSILLETKQEADIHRVVITPAERIRLDYKCRLDCGTIGYFAIENREGIGLLNQPSTEERADIEKRILRVSVGEHHKGFIVRPGKVIFAEAEESDLVILTALYKPVKANLYLFPR